MTTKLHLVITLEGHVVEGMLTGGNVADISVADKITEDISGCYVIEDKGYDSDKHRVSVLNQAIIYQLFLEGKTVNSLSSTIKSCTS
jgi:hypothetical protein